MPRLCLVWSEPQWKSALCTFTLSIYKLTRMCHPSDADSEGAHLMDSFGNLSSCEVRGLGSVGESKQTQFPSLSFKAALIKFFMSTMDQM